MSTGVQLVILVLIAAFIGGIGSSLLGWAKQQPPVKFDVRQFLVALLTAIPSAAGIAVTFNYSGVTNVALAALAAFLAGAGAVTGIGHVISALQARSKPPGGSPAGA